MAETTQAVDERQAEAQYQLAVALANRGRMAEALASFDRTLQLRPDHADARRERAMLLALVGRPREAARQIDALRARHPADPRVCYASAVAAFFSGDLQRARRDLEKVLDADPALPMARFNLGQIELLEGRLREGFALYESRWDSPAQQAQRRNFVPPQWDGERDLRAARLLVHAEQGLGDTIQFCRYLLLLAPLVRKLVFEVPGSLQSLIRRSLPEAVEVVARGAPLPAFDCHCPLMSLPRACATTLDSIPAPAPYLVPDPARIAAWRVRLGARARVRIGVAWSGSPAHSQDHARSLSPRAFGPLFQAAERQAPGAVEFVAIQNGARPEERDALAALPALRCFFPAMNDFDDSAALVALCDLVVCVDTAPAHLAGALGRPAWVLLPFVPDWRWMLERADSPWYPSARLFRQRALGDWDEVLARAAAALAQRLAEPGPAGVEPPA